MDYNGKSEIDSGFCPHERHNKFKFVILESKKSFQINFVGKVSMSSLWENSRICDNNFLIFLKRLVYFCMLLFYDGVSRPSWERDVVTHFCVPTRPLCMVTPSPGEPELWGDTIS